MKLLLNCISVATLLLGFCSPAIADAPPSAEQYYAQALENMKRLPQPENATYTVDVATSGASFGVVRDKKTSEAGVWWTLGSKKPGTPHFESSYRGASDTTTISLPDGPAITRFPIFNPTWSGISDWMRYGLDPPDPAKVQVKATPDPSAAIRTIATVRAMGVAYYNVSDAGSQPCPDGSAGHAVHLAARTSAWKHPLTHAIIELSTHQLCEVEFGFRQSGPLAATGRMALAIGDVDGAPLVTSEKIEFNVKVLAIQMKHIGSNVTFSNFAFPASLPEASPTP